MGRISKTVCWGQTASLIALAAPAVAQPEPSSASTAPSATAIAAEDPGEIVVTGLKRDERLIDTPVAIQVFGERAIAQAGITRPSDFLQLTPNVNFYSSINRGDFFVNVRGQTSIRGAEPSVRIVIDGVPTANPAEFASELVDVEQIEVLRGPQGAIYGRNASAGAIVITTKPPTDEWTGQVTAGYENFNTARANASFGGALIPGTLRIRGTLSILDTDGPFTNVNTAEKVARYDEKLARFRADWIASDRFTIDARVSLQHATGGSHSYLPQIGISPRSPNGTVVGGVPITQVDTNFVDIPFVADVRSRYVRDIFSTSLKADYELDFATFSSISSWSNTRQLSGGKALPYGSVADPTTNFAGWAALYGDATQNFYDQTRQFDQEIRLTSSDGKPFKWQVGAEYVWAKSSRHTNAALNGAVPSGQSPLGYNGFTNGVRTAIGGGALVPDPRILYGVDAATPSRNFTINNFIGRNISPFGNVQYDLGETLSFGLAARYDIEKRRTSSTGSSAINPFTGRSYNPCVRILRLTAEQCDDGFNTTYKQLQPKATVTYKIPGTGSVYASYGKGFKTGGYNQIGTRESLVLARTAVYLAEPGATPDSARAKAEAMVFTQDAYDKETADNFEVGAKVRLFDRRVNVSAAAFLTNIRNSQQYRFDVGAGLAAIDSIDRSRIKGFEFDVNARVTEQLTLFGGYGYIDSVVRRLRLDPSLEGNRMPYSAKYNLTAGAQLVTPITDTLELSARGEFNRTGSTWFDIQNTPGTRRDPYNIVNVRLGLVNERWEITGFSRNLFNKKYASEAIVLYPFLNVLARAQLRNYGLEGKVRF